MSRTVTTSPTHTTITTPANNAATGIPSIRQLVLTGILAGKKNAEIAQEIIKFHPASAAAKKSSKHINWYRSYAKKNGTPKTDA